MKVLVMGLSGSGKTFLSKLLQKELNCAWFNADNLREMADDWDFSTSGRNRQMRRMKSLADFESMEGRVVICDFICPTEDLRSSFGADFTIWMDTVKESKFKDTDSIFEAPKEVDIRITDWSEYNHKKIAEIIKNNV